MFKLPVQIKEEIDGYGRTLKEFAEGKITWARLSGIRVPWGNYSHRGGKVFMGRVRIPAGVLTAEQLQALAHCAKHHGNGLLHITTRQDIQIHEVKIEDIIKIHNYLKDYEFSSRGGGGNTVRNITVCPLAGICPKEIFDTREDAIALTEYLLSSPESYNLPRKLKISFSGCPTDCAGCLVNDVGLSAVRVDNKPGYGVYIGGGMGASPAIGKLLEEFISREDLGYVVLALRNAFYKYGDRKNKYHNRLRFLIEDIGYEKFRGYYEQELKALRESEHIVLRKIEFSTPGPKGQDFPPQADGDFKKFLKYNCLKQKEQGLVTVSLRIPRGDLEADKADAVSGLQKDFRGIEFRTSQEQNLYVAHVPQKNLYSFYLRIKDILEGFLYPSTLLDVVACKGSLTCNLGLCNSPALAREIEEMIKRDFLETKVFARLKLKINGCPNACGQHPIGLVSLHGVARKVGGRPVPFYKLFLGGRLGLEQTRLAQDTGILIPARNVPGFLKEFFQRINEEIDQDTDIYKYVREKGEKISREISKEYVYVPPYSENKDFYRDWGREEEFSLEGLGPGECGAGVLDIIESDLTEAGIAIENAERNNYPAEEIKRGLFLSARALLIVRGCDPETEEEALRYFKEKFIDAGIASRDYSNLEDVFAAIKDNLDIEKKREMFIYAKGFLEHIKQIYEGMDSAFNFTRQKEVSVAEAKKEINLLDLTGTPCPINYVKAKLFLENLKSGDIAEILLDDGEPINNVPKSLEGDGHRILKIERRTCFFSVTVRKGNEKESK